MANKLRGVAPLVIFELRLARENVPAELKELRVWLKWQLGKQKPNGKRVKIPIYSNGKPRSGVADGTADRSLLATFDEIVESFDADHDAGIAVALGPIGDDRILSGLDLDKCLEAGKPDERAARLIAVANSYAETTPYGEGIHILGWGDIGTHGADGSGLEIYSGRRFFTVTGRTLNSRGLMPLGEAASLACDLYGVPRTTGRRRPTKKAHRKIDPDELRAALAWMPNDVDRATWVDVAMAAKHEMGESAREAFIQWSKKHPSYDEDETVRVWETANPRGDVAAGTIFHVANQHGWKRSTVTPERALQLLVRPLSEIDPEKVEPLWPDRFFLGKMSLVFGLMGLGKSTLVFDIAARVTRGAEWPDGSRHRAPKGEVIILSLEDGAADTIRPRLEVAKADISKVHIIQGVEETDARTQKKSRRTFSLVSHMGLLDAALAERPDVNLVIVDPISGVFHGADTHKTAEVREVLAGLTEVCERHHACFLGVSHPNKSQGQSAAYRATGSLALTAGPRSVYVVGRNPLDEDGRVVFAELKNNLAPQQQALAFEVVGVPHSVVGSVACIRWLGVATETPDDILDPASPRTRAAEQRTDTAARWLERILRDGPQPATQIREWAEKAEISKRALDRASEELQVTKIPHGRAGTWEWSLPRDDAE